MSRIVGSGIVPAGVEICCDNVVARTQGESKDIIKSVWVLIHRQDSRK